MFMQVITSCPDYPPHNYTLVVVGDSWTDPIFQTALATGGSVIKIDLMWNTHYLYYMISTNRFGSSHQSASVGIGRYVLGINNLVLIIPLLSYY